MSGQNMSIEQVLGQIEDQSEFSFFYNNREVDLSKEVTLDVRNKPVDEIMNYLMDQTGLSYTVNNKLIIIHKSQKSELGSLTSQSQKVSGKITDSSGQPLPGVTVLIKGTTQGTITDYDGNYTIDSVPAEGVLVFLLWG